MWKSRKYTHLALIFTFDLTNFIVLFYFHYLGTLLQVKVHENSPGVHCYSVGDQSHVLTGYVPDSGGHGQEGQYQDQNPSCHGHR